MKKILLLTLLSALAAVSMGQAAGPTGGAPQNPTLGQGGKGAHISKAEREKMEEEILSKLNLTEDQKTKIVAHRKEMAGKILELRKSAKGAKGAKGAGLPDDVKEKLKALRKEDQDFMKANLTKDQMRQMQKLRREKMKELREKGATPPQP